MAVKYNDEVLDLALDQCGSSDEDERKKGARVLRRSSCLELGTKNTLTVMRWFIFHTDELVQTIRQEDKNDILWEYIYALHSFCNRYIRLAHLVKNTDEIMDSARRVYFEEQIKLLIEEYVRSEDMKVLIATASFLWGYRDRRAWDMFAKVLDKKRDALTLSHIEVAISVLHREVMSGGCVRGLIGEEQAVQLCDRLCFIADRKAKSERRCREMIAMLKEVVSCI